MMENVVSLRPYTAAVRKFLGVDGRSTVTGISPEARSNGKLEGLHDIISSSVDDTSDCLKLNPFMLKALWTPWR